MDVGQLAGRVVLIGAFEQGGFVVAAAQQLFLQAPGRVPLLGLQQVVALVAGDFAVQVVAFVAIVYGFGINPGVLLDSLRTPRPINNRQFLPLLTAFSVQ